MWFSLQNDKVIKSADQGSASLQWSQCYSDHSNLEMQAGCLMKNLLYLNLNISRQKMVEISCKKYQNKEELQKHTDCFHITQITDKNMQFTFKKLRFSTFTTFSLLPQKLHGCRFLYFFSLHDVRNELVFVSLEYFSLGGLNRKKTRKNMKFWPSSLLQKIQLKNMTIRKIF